MYGYIDCDPGTNFVELVIEEVCQTPDASFWPECEVTPDPGPVDPDPVDPEPEEPEPEPEEPDEEVPEVPEEPVEEETEEDEE